MNNLAIKGETIISGVKIPNINGGFGINKKAMLAKHIADIHDKELKKVNELINKNRNRFKDSIDIIDVKDNEFEVVLKDHGILTQNSLNRATNIYLLSERGYAKLIKMFDDDKSWELYDTLLDEYFELREEMNNTQPIHNKPMSQAEMLVMYAQQFVEQEHRLNELESKSNQIHNKVTNIQEYLIESPDNKKIQHEINCYSRKHDMNQSEVRVMIYKKIEDKYGIDVMTRVKNGRIKINKERVQQGKKPYKNSTLKSKLNGMNIIVEEGLTKEVIEILAGLVN